MMTCAPHPGMRLSPRRPLLASLGKAVSSRHRLATTHDARGPTHLASAASSGIEQRHEQGSEGVNNQGEPATMQQPATMHWLERVKEFVTCSKQREKVASLGMAAFLSYGSMSNFISCCCLTTAWIAFVKQTGVSPLATGQYTNFVAFYAGLWTLRNMTFAARFALALAVTPVFDKLLDWIAARTGSTKKVGFTIMLGVIAVSTATGLFSAIYLLGGFPDGIGPFPALKPSL